MKRGVRLCGAGFLFCLWMSGTACRGVGSRGNSPERLESADEAARGRDRRQTPVAEIAPAPARLGPPLAGPAGLDEDGYPKRYVDRAVLRSLLRAKRYADLTRHFEDFQAAFESNPRNEYWPIDAADAFSTADPELLPQLDAWVMASPDSFAPHLARGAYWVDAGYARRGARWASETHQSNFEAMEDAHQRAMANLEKALEICPKLVAAYRLEIRVLMASSGDVEAVATAALNSCPECFQVRVTLQTALMPRWGGSYQAMLAAAAAAPVAKNRRLRLLPGYVDFDKARVLSRDKKPRLAIEAIQRACDLGDHWQFLLERASIFEELGELEQANRDIERAAELRPGHPDILFDRAEIAFERKEYEAAGRDLIAGLRIDPTDSDGRRIFKRVVQGLVYQGWEHHKAGRKEDALRLLDLAAELDPKNPEVQQRRIFLIAGAGSTATQDQISALAAKARSAPNDFRAHQEFDYALAKQGRFAEVIEMWNEYLSRHPDDGRAHLERGGAFWNMGRREEARADVTRACDLGVSEGCARAKQSR